VEEAPRFSRCGEVCSLLFFNSSILGDRGRKAIGALGRENRQ
jgi:hypothetical protein